MVVLALEEALHLRGRDVDPLVAVAQRPDLLWPGSRTPRHHTGSFANRLSRKRGNSSLIV
jgi:hypothetical protein